MTANLVIGLALAIPLIGMLLLLAARHWPNLRDSVLVFTAAGMFVAVSSLLPEVQAGERPSLELFTIARGFTIAFEVEPLGMVFAMLASGLWIVTSLYAIGYLRGTNEAHQTRFHAFFAIALFAVLGIAFAANMFTLFVFYELLSLSTYPLVAHKGTREAKRGARVYLGLLLGTSIGFQLLAILLTWWHAGTLDFTDGGIMEGKVGHDLGAVLLVLYLYGIGKAALMPFHRWLPSAMVAPTPVSALLHAVAVVKAGVFTVLKVSVYLFGLDYLEALATTVWLMYIAAFTMITASVVAMTKDNLKARLAYSTVSQLAYVVLGAMLVSPIAAVGGAMHIVMHAFGKITLFFCAGAIYVATRKTEISQLDGLGRRMPFTMGAFLLGALCVIGAPPMGGLWSKWHLILGAIDSGHAWMIAAFLLSTLLNVAYLIPPVMRAFLLPLKDGEPPGVREAPLLCVLPLSFTALGALALFFLAATLRALLQGMFAG
ncbi:MAG: monovalent cation/H+ antiporter subunit D family protein [Thiotrichales bacterium]